MFAVCICPEKSLITSLYGDDDDDDADGEFCVLKVSFNSNLGISRRRRNDSESLLAITIIGGIMFSEIRLQWNSN